MNSNVKYVGTFMAGIALGVAAGILLAPDSGEHTRKKLVDESKKLKDQFSDSLSKTLGSLKTTYNKKLDELTRSGKEELQHAKDLVS